VCNGKDDAHILFLFGFLAQEIDTTISHGQHATRALEKYSLFHISPIAVPQLWCNAHKRNYASPAAK
jgi:hypothetical protein